MHNLWCYNNPSKNLFKVSPEPLASLIKLLKSFCNFDTFLLVKPSVEFFRILSSFPTKSLYYNAPKNQDNNSKDLIS